MKKLHNGQKIYDRVHGWGVVHEITENGYYVMFPNKTIYIQHPSYEKQIAAACWIMFLAYIGALIYFVV